MIFNVLVVEVVLWCWSCVMSSGGKVIPTEGGNAVFTFEENRVFGTCPPHRGQECEFHFGTLATPSHKHTWFLPDTAFACVFAMQYEVTPRHCYTKCVNLVVFVVFGKGHTGSYRVS